MITEIEKDILLVEKGIIVHQVNCQKVMGAGLAKQLSEKFPQVKKEYLAKANWNLGDTQFVKIKDDLVVCNLAGQYSFGRKQKVYTVYTALIKGFNSVLNYSLSNGNLNIFIPYGMGCGLARGDWQEVSSIIVDIFGDTGIELYCFICKN